MATSYLIVVGDSMPKALEAFGADGLLTRRHFWSAAAALLVSPLVFQRRVDSLRFASVVAIACIAAVVILVVLFAFDPSPLFNPCPATLLTTLHAYAPNPHPHPHPNTYDASLLTGDARRLAGAPPLPPATPAPVPCREPASLYSGSLPSLLHAVPIFVFAYTCHQNIISITNELHDPTRRRAGITIVSAIGLALLLYIIMAICGYETFGASVHTPSHPITRCHAPSDTPDT